MDKDLIYTVTFAHVYTCTKYHLDALSWRCTLVHCIVDYWFDE